MSWYSEGAAEADKMSSGTFRRTKNFFTRKGEAAARIRFLSPAAESFNYKRAFVKWAPGQKLLTSPQTVPDPFVEAGLQLQTAFAWKIIDRRVLEFDDKTTGESKKVGPRVLFFADGTRTRKQLLAFEKEVLANENEARAEEGKEPLSIEDFNLTHYDVKAYKESGSPWLFTAMRPKSLSGDDKALAEKEDFDLREELKPLPEAELNALLKGADREEGATTESDTTYSYDDDDDDTVKFDE